jgi:hypothetical protein
MSLARCTRNRRVTGPGTRDWCEVTRTVRKGGQMGRGRPGVPLGVDVARGTQTKGVYP